MRISSGLVVMAVVLSGCCTVHCPAVFSVTLVFVDASGNPLTPLEVSDGTTTFQCDPGDAGVAATCNGNTLNYIQFGGPPTITARSTTGEEFTGTITLTEKSRIEPQGCGCPAITYEPVTIT